MFVEVLSSVQTSHLESQWLTCLYQLYAFESGLHVSLIQQTAHLEMLYPVMWLSQDIFEVQREDDGVMGLQSEMFHVTVKQLLMYWYGYLQQSYNLPEPLQLMAWSPDHAVKWSDTFDVKKSYDDVVERMQSDFAYEIERQLMTCRQRYLKQSDNSRSQDHSEVLPGEKVSTHTTDSVSQEEFPHINYSTPIQHTINQELNGGMDMSRTTLSSLMTSMDGSSMSCSKLQIITPTEFRSKEDSENSQQAVSSPPTVSQMIAALKRRIDVSYFGLETEVLAGSEDGLVQCLKQL